MKFAKLAIALGLCAAGFSASAQTANMAVNANIAGSCSVIVSALNFLVYDPLSATANTAESSTAITCTSGAGAALSMGIGGFSTGTGATAQRRLRAGPAGSYSYLNYNIFQPLSAAPGANCDYTTPWGDNTTGGARLAIGAAPTAAARTFKICGQIPALQASAIGSYADTIVVTANL